MNSIDRGGSAAGPQPLADARVLRLGQRFVFAGVVALFFLALSYGLVRTYPERFYSTDWLLHEHGNQFYRAELIRSGLVPYRDFESQYGPLPLYFWAFASRWLGNTIQGCVAFHILVSVGVIATLAGWLSGAVRTRGQLCLLGGLLGMASLAQTVLYLNPVLLCTGINVEYLSFERLWLIGMAMLWRPPAARTAWHAILQGALFGAWQLSKFGGAFYGICALLAVDVLYWWCHGDPNQTQLLKRAWIRLGVCVAVAEALRVLGFFLVLSPDVAARSLWPFWVVGTYPNTALTLWDGWKHMLTYNFPIWIPLSLGAAVVGAWLVPPWRERTRRWVAPEWLFPTLVLWVFFVGGMVYRVGYFRREWHFFQYAWTLVPLILLVAVSVRPWGSILTLVAYSVSTVMYLRSMHAPVRQAKSPIVSWNGRIGTAFSPKEDTALSIWVQAHAWLAAHPTSRFCLIDCWSGGAWYVERNQPILLRNNLFAVGVRSPADEEEFRAKLPTLDCLIVRLGDIPADGARTQALREHFTAVISPEIAERILSEFKIEIVVGEWNLLSRTRTAR